MEDGNSEKMEADSCMMERMDTDVIATARPEEIPTRQPEIDQRVRTSKSPAEKMEADSSTAKKMKTNSSPTAQPDEESSSMSDQEDMDPRMRKYYRRLPRELLEQFREMRLPPKLLSRMLNYGGHEELEEMMEMNARMWRREPRPKRPDPEDDWAEGWGVTAQSKPLSETQVQNSAGGFVNEVDDLTRLRRWICLGSEKGTYYVSQADLSADNMKVIYDMIKQHKGDDVVQELLKLKGRCAKQNVILLVLATCAMQGTDLKAKRAAYKALPELCGTPSQLFQFLEYYNNMKPEGSGKGWGRAHRIGIMNWYYSYKNNPSKLAMHVTKYRQRNGWSHKDLLRLCHIKPASDRSSEALNVVFKFLARGLDVVQRGLSNDDSEEVRNVFEYLVATETIKKLSIKNADEMILIMRKHNLVREHLPTEVLNLVHIWRQLLQKMPMFAMIRNLGKMSSMGMLENRSEDSVLVCQKLSNGDIMRNAKVHPFNILLAQTTYAQGHGDLGKHHWKVNSDVVDALDKAFHLSFKAIEPTNKRYLIALDVSPSMDLSNILGTKITARTAAAAMAMVTARTEPHHEIVRFAGGLAKLDITPEDSLQTAISKANCHNFEGTDCSRPMLYAYRNKKYFDVFVIYTDNETWSGTIHATEALRRYRAASEIHNARLVVVAFTSSGFTIADPKDKYMLDVVGFDSRAPEIINNFVLGIL